MRTNSNCKLTEDEFLQLKNGDIIRCKDLMYSIKWVSQKTIFASSIGWGIPYNSQFIRAFQRRHIDEVMMTIDKLCHNCLVSITCNKLNHSLMCYFNTRSNK